MPYVLQPDRPKLVAAVETLAQELARTITVNLSVIPALHHTLVAIAHVLREGIRPGDAPPRETPPHHRAAVQLAEEVLRTAVSHGTPADGYALGPCNYAVTRLLQRIPQIKVERGDWVQEMRYWIVPEYTEALHLAARDTMDLGIGIGGTFIDVLAEYRSRAAAAYEVFQQTKNGDCFDTPYYSKPVSLVDRRGRRVGYAVAYVERSPDTVDAPELPQVLLVTEPDEQPAESEE